MAKARQIQPTEAELAILRVLWSRGPSTVREVHAALGGDARSRYTTTLKQLQVMAEKRLVERDESQRSHVYAAAVEESQTEQSLVARFIDRVLEGSVQRVVVHALESGKVSDKELAQIRRILRQWEKQK